MRALPVLVVGIWLCGLAHSTTSDVADQGRPDLAACSELDLRVGGLFRVGTARLYLENCQHARQDILAPVAKQFSLEVARRFSGQDLSEVAHDLLRRNLDLSKDDALPEGLACLADAYVDVDAGDRYDVSYLPELGLALHLNGELLTRCENTGLAEKYFLIWFGDEPFHRRMRDTLLQRAETTVQG